MTINETNNDMLRPVVIPIHPNDARTGSVRRLTPESIRERFSDSNVSEIFRSGSGSVTAQVKGILQQLRVGSERLHQEQFVVGKLVVTEAPAEQPNDVIEFVKSGRSARLVPNRNVLETAELNGIDIPAGCRHGHCGLCATRLLSGDVRMDCEDGLDPALKAQGYVLPCIGHARGNVRLDA
jgi:ferredoxin